MKALMRAAAGCALVILAACGGDSTAPIAVAGAWSGSSGGVNFGMTLVQNGSTVTGNGQVNGPGGSAAATISGTYTQPNVSLTITATGLQPANFTGTIASGGGSMSGTINGSGFTNQPITFNKQ